MTETEKEDLLIKRILMTGVIFIVGGFLSTLVLVAVMVSFNFNFLNWME